RWWSMMYPDEVYRAKVKTEWDAKVAKAVSTNSPMEPMEATVRCKDGTHRHIEFHFSSFGEMSLVSFVDVTERRESEAALRNSEEFSRNVVMSSPLAMV